MRSSHEVADTLALIASGLSDYEVSRRSGVPRSTVLRWRTDGAPDVLSAPCPICDGTDNLPSREYVDLLGLYLGDGWIGEHRRAVHRLNVYLDSRYPGIVSACADAMEAVRPGQRADRYPKPTANMVIVRMYSRHWPCLFPQHGPGPKHKRPINVVPWQQDLVDREPEALLRGLIHSDGCRVVNRVVTERKAYEYSRYHFSNRSQDIHAIFRDACDRIGVEWRASGRYTTNVSKRASVAKLDTFIGPKA
jgi:hypothetical protein